MSYPDYPENRLIVNGVDLTLKYGLILIDGYKLDPPEVKKYEVDIPGGDGVIDLTESLLGDSAYKNREIELEFYIIDIGRFEDIMTEINRELHGKSFDFKLTMDPEYTYHGRFKISDQKQNRYMNGLVGSFKMTIDGNPYKYKNDAIYCVNAVGGKTVQFESGRKKVRPTIETDGFLKVIYNNKLYTLPQGTWTLNDVIFKEGVNEVYFNSYDVKNLTWGQLKESEVTFGGFKDKRLYEWYKSNGDGHYVISTWDTLSEQNWQDLYNKTWRDLIYMADITENIKDVYVKYKVGDI